MVATLTTLANYGPETSIGDKLSRGRKTLDFINTSRAVKPEITPTPEIVQRSLTLSSSAAYSIRFLSIYFMEADN